MDLSRLNVDRNSSYTLSLFWGGGLLRKNPGFLEYLNSGFLPIPESKYLLKKKISPFIPHNDSRAILGIPENSQE